jgi:membrane protein
MDHVPTRRLKRLKSMLTQSLRSWVDHRVSSKAAALAFYTLFSMTPILVLAIAFAGYVFGEQAAQGELVSRIEGLVGIGGAVAVQALLAGARDSVSGLVATLVAGAFLFLGATSVFAELKGSLDEMWGITHPGTSIVRLFLRTRLLSFSLVIVLALLLLVTLIASLALAMMERYPDWAPIGSVIAMEMSVGLISFAVMVCMFALIFKTMPDSPLSWRDVWIGAAFTSGLFSLGKYAIGAYLSHSAVASSFGAAGSVIALLLWVYYSAQVFFLGAEFTQQYALWFGSLRQDSADADDVGHGPHGMREAKVSFPIKETSA